MAESACPLLRALFYHIDDRVDQYYLLSSVWKPLAIVAIYFLLILKILPKYMENREPFNLRKILIVHNVVQIGINTFIIAYGFRSFIIHQDWLCVPMDYTRSYDGERELFACYVFYLTKILDLLDTVFFVLKKNKRQVTYLHLYHHSAMVIFTWFVIRYAGGGHSLWAGFFNCSVHIIMYSYYLLTAHNAAFKNNLVLKRSITQIQMVQFVCISTFHTIAMLRPSCTFPRVALFLSIAQNVYFFYLFSQFYLKTYMKKTRPNGEVRINGKSTTNGTTNGRVLNPVKNSNGKLE